MAVTPAALESHQKTFGDGLRGLGVRGQQAWLRLEGQSVWQGKSETRDRLAQVRGGNGKLKICERVVPPRVLDLVSSILRPLEVWEDVPFLDLIAVEFAALREAAGRALSELDEAWRVLDS